LQGTGYFAGEDGEEQELSANDMAVFGANETHTARAEGEQLVFIAILHEAAHAKHDH
jgi:quercetin dioxygenase-like cupin family protein